MIISGEGKGCSQRRAIDIEKDLSLVLMELQLTVDLIVDIVDAAGAGAQLDGKPGSSVISRVEEGIITCMNIGDGEVGLQIHEGHLVRFLLAYLKG